MDKDACSFRRLFFMSSPAYPCPWESTLLPLILAFLPLSLGRNREVLPTTRERGL